MTELSLASGTSLPRQPDRRSVLADATISGPAYRRITGIDSPAMPPLPVILFGCALLGAVLLASGALWLRAIRMNPIDAVFACRKNVR